MIAAVVLAAGASRRYGEHKLLLPLQGKPLIRRTVEQLLASQVDEVVVVLGREAEAVRRALDELPARCVVNPDFQEGMSTSLRAGIEALGLEVEAALIVLADQPSVGPAILDRLIESYQSTGKSIVVPSYQGERGNPVLFAASLFAEISQVQGDQGARALISRESERVAVVPFAFPAPRDVDTAEDYEALLQQEHTSG